MKLIKKNYLKYILLGVALTLLSACQSHTSKHKRVLIQTSIKVSLEETIDTFLARNFSDDSPGIGILVLKEGQVVYKNGRGLANKHSNRAITSETGFRLASVSKPFTALAVMQLFEKRLLFLEDSILKFLPELPSKWSNINIHHLLSHQSGIPDINNTRDLPFKDWLDTNKQAIEYFKVNDSLKFVPGTQAEYSNSGYVLLAEIVSRVSGQRFSDYMQNHFFYPLKMNNSYIADEYSKSLESDALNYAEFATLKGQNVQTYGSSGQVSSLNDMALFVEALLNEKIVEKKTFALMTQKHSLNIFDDLAYGYGWLLVPKVAGIYAHGGSNDGFLTNIELKTNLGIHLVFLSNSGHIEEHFKYIGNLIIDFYQNPLSASKSSPPIQHTIM
jgi:CubicO group peptidase (beta-lactamase class C family)